MVVLFFFPFVSVPFSRLPFVVGRLNLVKGITKVFEYKAYSLVESLIIDALGNTLDIW